MMDVARNILFRYWRLMLGLSVLIFLVYITPLPATKQQYSSYSIFDSPSTAGHGGIHVRVRVTDDVPLWPDFDDPPEDVRISTELRHKIYPNPPQRDEEKLGKSPPEHGDLYSWHGDMHPVPSVHSLLLLHMVPALEVAEEDLSRPR